ncbi:hypothetical protein ACQ3I4_11520 [Zafaria sp. Z1313]|uniref:hypothetical protein n=1 Tax=unclassified Zafaria TaxID=2828765 RepID=UPI002E7952EB|nr:hypothetical protein [Zafaria sp. J156]MEE1620295.1 hypothetical protein [Zafaria sp. J156]
MAVQTAERVHERPQHPAMVDGSAALAAVPTAPPVAAPEAPARTPLSIVPAAVRNRRMPFIALCFSVLLAALASVLVLNVQVASGQYELVALRGTEQTLAQENEALAQQVQNLEAPQNLAARASKLGMVVPGAVASIDLGTGKVSGVATPATEDTTVTSNVARPEAPQTGLPKAKAPASVPAAAAPEHAGSADATDPSGAEAPAGAGAEAAAREEASDRPAFTEAELNGGSIPAPAQQGADSGE